ncbi:MAG: tRNA (N(6)-L-threonylcarbamoyladenosine(37)-C(2))-methylthiotransferase MtaB [Dehalococcoidia bacterium]|nr:tRNA (N(6)-L-threonylcarbamoyladenosine(37)-C(2))-methylthiotransferase MtaB [Dehalococcoidia bacterium]
MAARLRSGQASAPTVAVLTLGCKLNQADSEAIARSLGGNGVRVVDRPAAGADAFVINTCSVTHVADRKARHLVRLARRLSPQARIVLTGCYAETAPAYIAGVIGADAVIGNDAKTAIPQRLLARLQGRGEPAAGCPAPVGSGLRTRAFVKIQEGCNELCAFCIVPYTRGREVSVPVAEVVEQVRAREAEGAIEVVLTGTQLGNYGRDLGWREHGPRRLLEALLERTRVPRLRLSSLQAQDISPELVRLWHNPRLCPHFHLPLQSGSDPVLKAMRRRYTAQQYREAVGAVRESVPDVAITTDVIAGFPGETAADFEQTYRLCEEMQFAAMHCFPYSKRPHTGAAQMAGHLPPAPRRARLERLLELARRSSRAFRRRLLGSTVDVLWEQESAGLWQGLTANYVRVYTSADVDLSNRLLPVRLTGLEGADLRGVLEEASVSA